MKKRILCFGDSNTYGSNPAGGRFDAETRYPMRMAALLGPDYTVLEEGLGGRTVCFDDPVEGGYKSGAAYLPPCLLSHNPLDLVILMLGTNDAKQRFGMNAVGDRPRCLIVAPPHIGENLPHTGLIENFGAQAIETSHGFAKEYLKISRIQKADFLDAAQVCSPSERDAVHLTAQGHLALAGALAAKVRALLEG